MLPARGRHPRFLQWADIVTAWQSSAGHMIHLIAIGKRRSRLEAG
jgi:hypothetical protein